MSGLDTKKIAKGAEIIDREMSSKSGYKFVNSSRIISNDN